MCSFRSFYMIELIVILLHIYSLAIIATENLVTKSFFSIVIDAGSTGSRAFIFQIFERFDKDGNRVSRELFSQKCKKIQPGISDLLHENLSSESLAEYMIPIFVEAASMIPSEFYESTNVYIQGTAGMRLLPEVEQNTLWESLTQGLNNHKSNFFKIDINNLGTISGHLEAYYAVLSSNYIAGNIDANLKTLTDGPLLGALDMGGSSTQLIFYNGNEDSKIISPDNFWSHSWLNFGVEKVREKVEQFIIETKESLPSESPLKVFNNPCTFNGYEYTFSNGVVLKGTGNALECVDIIRQVIWPDNLCSTDANKDKPCYLDGIEHPPVRGEFYGMSVYFFAIDCVRQLGTTDLHSWPTPTIDEIEVAVQEFCGISWSSIQETMSINRHRYTQDFKLPHRCLEVLYITLLLEDGFGFDGSHRNITLALDLEGQEVEWTLGFALAELHTDLIPITNDNLNPSPDLNTTDDSNVESSVVHKRDENPSIFYQIFVSPVTRLINLFRNIFKFIFRI